MKRIKREKKHTHITLKGLGRFHTGIYYLTLGFFILFFSLDQLIRKVKNIPITSCYDAISE